MAAIQWHWYIRGISTTAYGASTDRTVPADYNGDGRADIAVWRPSNGSWYDRGQSAVQFGASGDIPVSVLPFDWIYPFRYAFPIQGCTVSYGHTHHDYPATDIFAARGCAVVSPVTGRIDEVSTVDRWNPSTNKGAGLAISIVGDDGVRYYGSHLSAITSGIRPGARVLAGQPIGRVGNTGSARGISTHLHFGLSWPTPPGFWWIRRGEVYPWPYLDAWRAGHNSSPAPAVEAERARQGTTPPCRVYC